MRIKSFQIRAVAPIQLVQVEDLADVVVFAGPNGVGKTSIGTRFLISHEILPLTQMFG